MKNRILYTHPFRFQFEFTSNVKLFTIKLSKIVKQHNDIVHYFYVTAVQITNNKYYELCASHSNIFIHFHDSFHSAEIPNSPFSFIKYKALDKSIRKMKPYETKTVINKSNLSFSLNNKYRGKKENPLKCMTCNTSHPLNPFNSEQSEPLTAELSFRSRFVSSTFSEIATRTQKFLFCFHSVNRFYKMVCLPQTKSIIPNVRQRYQKAMNQTDSPHKTYYVQTLCDSSDISIYRKRIRNLEQRIRNVSQQIYTNTNKHEHTHAHSISYTRTYMHGVWFTTENRHQVKLML